jgi:phosphatidylinositol alpha-1,6-mannosyltransferase
MARNILILTHEFPPFYGGIGTYCAEMAAEAAAMGHRVTVLAPSYGQDHKSDDRARPYRVVRFPGGLYKTANMPRVLWEVLKIDVSAYDIVHAAEWSFAVACHVLYPVKKFRFITTLHGTDIFGFETSRVVKVLRARKALSHAKMVTANSHFTANLARRFHPYYPEAQIVTAYPGVNAFWFTKAENAGALSQKYDIPQNRRIVLSVARLDPRKGHAHVLNALRLLPQEDKDQLAYIIVGGADNEEHEKSLRKLAGLCGVPVVFAGTISREDIRGLYRESWVFCLPGQKDPRKVEGFGLVYLEAAAQGLPSIATPVGGVPEVVIDGTTGWLLEGDAPEELAKIFSALLKDPAQVSACGASARERAGSFSWRRCAEQTYNADAEKAR